MEETTTIQALAARFWQRASAALGQDRALLPARERDEGDGDSTWIREPLPAALQERLAVVTRGSALARVVLCAAAARLLLHLFDCSTRLIAYSSETDPGAALPLHLPVDDQESLRDFLHRTQREVVDGLVYAEFWPRLSTPSTGVMGAGRDLSFSIEDGEATLRCSKPVAASDARRVLATFVHILAQTATPGTKALTDLTWVRAEEVDDLQSLQAPCAVWSVSTLDGGFDLQLECAPNALAAIDGERTMTYRQLDDMAARIATRLGPRDGEVIAVNRERGVEFLAAVLAVLRCGAAFLPLDPRYPASRIRQMTTIGDAGIVLDTERLDAWIDRSANPVVQARGSSRSVSAGAAYLMFTSGSSGTPKGAILRHDGAVNHIFAEARALGLSARDHLLQNAPCYSDISVWQMLGPLVLGAAVVFASDADAADPARLFDLMRRHGVTVAEVVPAVLRGLIEHVRRLDASERTLALRWLMVTGEAATPALINAWLALYPDVPVVYAYGPTEASDDVAQSVLRSPLPPDAVVPIGRPLTNVPVYVVDCWKRMVPAGVVGEIVVAGVAVADGYRGDAARTAESFVPDAITGRHGARLYRTGDRGRWNADGELEFLGRIDDQVKINGHRVEIGDVQSALEQCSGVRECAVMVQAVAHGPAVLQAFYRKDHAGIAEQAIRRGLEARLPAHMMPSRMVAVDRIPRLPSGKVDRQALLALRPLATGTVPKTAAEKAIAGIWEQVLGTREVVLEHNFFELGGDSILAIEASSASRQTRFTFTPRQLFERQSLGELAAVVAERIVTDLVADETTVAPLAPFQRWLLGLPLTHPEHWNMSVLLRCPRLDPAAVDAGFRALQTRHASLRLRFTRRDGEWQQRCAPPSEAVEVTMVELGGDEASHRDQILSAARRMQSSLDLERGPITRMLLFQTPGGGHSYLFWAIHHLAVDGRAWTLLLADFHSMLLAPEKPLPAPSGSFLDWCTKQPQAASTSAGLQTDTVGTAHRVLRVLDAGATADLQAAVGKFGTTLQAALLAAFAQGIASERAQQHLLIDVEQHGRDDAPDVVGCCTRFATFDVDLAGSDFKSLCGTLEASLRASTHAPSRAPSAAIAFNFLGRFEAPEGYKLLRDWELQDRYPGDFCSHAIDLNCWIWDGELHFEWTAGSSYGTLPQLEAIAAICVRILQREGAEAQSLAWERESPLLPLQQSMLLEAARNPGRHLYHQQLVCRVQGSIDPERWERTWARLVQRHDALRSAVSGSRLLTMPAAAIPWRHEDWSCLSEETQSSYLQLLLYADRHRPFDVSAAPLLRMATVRTGAGSFLLVMSNHHLILDGWSIALLWKEALELYADEHALLPVAPAFHRFVVAQTQKDHDDAESFWRDYLRGSGGEVAGAFTPQDEELGECVEVWDEDFAASVAAFGRQHHVTLNTLIVAAWAYVLRGSSDAPAAVFDVVTGGRTEQNSQTSMVGLLVQTMTVCVRFGLEHDRGAMLRELQAKLRDAACHAFVSVGALQRWSGVPRARTIVATENYPLDTSAFAACAWKLEDVRPFERPGHALSVLVSPGDRLTVRIVFDGANASAADARAALQGLREMLAAMVRGDSFSVAKQGPSAVEKLWRGPALPPMPPRCMHSFFEAAVAKCPDAVAIADGSVSLTYRELNDRANSLAAALQSRGAGPEQVVGLCMERTAQQIVAVLGVLKSGAAYLPMEPSFPLERRRFMFSAAGAKLLLCSRALEGLGDMEGVTALQMDEVPAGGVPLPLADPACAAYVLFTSGSTGEPKGVVVEHHTLGNMARAQEAVAEEVEGGVRVLQFASLCFDVSVFDMLLAWQTAGTLCIATTEHRLSARGLEQALADYEATHAMVPPSVLGMVDPEAVPDLRVVYFAGEALPQTVAAQWSAHATVYNIYGPTETTVWVTADRFDVAAEGAPPIGFPAAGSGLYILDASLAPTGNGVSGGIYIGGSLVSRGYIGRPALTAERFLPDPFSGIPGVRMYFTGDIGRRRDNGSIDYLGRSEWQIKIRGQRVEPGEISATLERHPDVAQASVAMCRVGNADRLVAYVVSSASSEELRAFLRERLPPYMVPSSFVHLAAMPLSANGKVDRGALPPPGEWREEGEERLPRSAAEAMVAAVWKKILGTGNLAPDINFFDAGGDSLAVMQLQRALEAAFRRDVPLVDLFRHPNIAQQAAWLGDGSLPSEAMPRVRQRIAAMRGRA